MPSTTTNSRPISNVPNPRLAGSLGEGIPRGRQVSDTDYGIVGAGLLDLHVGGVIDRLPAFSCVAAPVRTVPSSP
jgi:hypothetical protein